MAAPPCSHATSEAVTFVPSATVQSAHCPACLTNSTLPCTSIRPPSDTTTEAPPAFSSKPNHGHTPAGQNTPSAVHLPFILPFASVNSALPLNSPPATSTPIDGPTAFHP